MALSANANLLSLSEASKLGVSALVRLAEGGNEQVILRRGATVAVIMGMERFTWLLDLQEDLIELALATSRMATTSEARQTLDAVLEQFGYSREDLSRAPKPSLDILEPETSSTDRRDAKPIAPATHPLVGKWRIIDTDQWNHALDLDEPAIINFDTDGTGNFAFGAVSGYLSCWFHPRRIEFTWEGWDDMHQVSGSGSAELQADGTLLGDIRYHLGDESGFRAIRW